MSENTQIKEREEWFDTYGELAQLAKEANITVVLELLTALRHSKDDVEARDRLNQAITHILAHRQWRQSLGLESTCFELLSNMSSSESPLVEKLFTIIASLPLTFAENCHHCHYASLSGKELLDLIEILIEQPTFTNNVQPDHNFVIRLYLQVCIPASLYRFTRDLHTEPKRKNRGHKRGVGPQVSLEKLPFVPISIARNTRHLSGN